MKTAYGKGLRIALLSFILAVMASDAALAGVRLDLGTAPLYPGEVVYPGDTVQIPIFLTNYPGGPDVIATSNEITYESAYLTPLLPNLGPKSQEAGKSISQNITEPGLYVVGVYGIVSLNTPILDGIVVFARFKVRGNAPAGTYALGNTAACTTLGGEEIPVSGIAGFIEVTEPISSTTTTLTATIPTTSTTTSAASTTTTLPATTTIHSTTSTTAAQEECPVTLTPSAISVASTETVSFSATVTNAACSTPQPAWSVDSAIGSTIDENGRYTAGENTTGTEASDKVLVTDAANKTVATATVTVSALPVGAITRIAPSTIRSSPWRPRLHLLIIRSDQGNFSNTATLSFNPPGDIHTLQTMSAGKIMLALVSVKPDVQGSYDVKVSTDTMIYLKKDSLNVRHITLLSAHGTKGKPANTPGPGGLLFTVMAKRQVTETQATFYHRLKRSF